MSGRKLVGGWGLKHVATPCIFSAFDQWRSSVKEFGRNHWCLTAAGLDRVSQEGLDQIGAANTGTPAAKILYQFGS
jgi:hypothetical protein